MIHPYNTSTTFLFPYIKTEWEGNHANSEEELDRIEKTSAQYVIEMQNISSNEESSGDGLKCLKTLREDVVNLALGVKLSKSLYENKAITSQVKKVDHKLKLLANRLKYNQDLTEQEVFDIQTEIFSTIDWMIQTKNNFQKDICQIDLPENFNELQNRIFEEKFNLGFWELELKRLKLLFDPNPCIHDLIKTFLQLFILYQKDNERWLEYPEIREQIQIHFEKLKKYTILGPEELYGTVNDARNFIKSIYDEESPEEIQYLVDRINCLYIKFKNVMDSYPNCELTEVTIFTESNEYPFYRI
jgi:hypothetical protein